MKDYSMFETFIKDAAKENADIICFLRPISLAIRTNEFKRETYSDEQLQIALNKVCELASKIL